LPNSSNATRPQMITNEKLNQFSSPIAEHGFSALVSITRTSSKINKTSSIESNNIVNKSYRFLFDTGISENSVIHNSKIFGIDLSTIDGIILSHGHFDHFTGIYNIVEKITSLSLRAKVDIFTHPDAFLKRWVIHPDKMKVKLPFLDENKLNRIGGQIHKNKKPLFIPNNEDYTLLITGEIPRKTIFEKGYPFQYAEDDNDEKKLIHDPFVKDDQAIIMNVKNKGLVILTGCGHAGIINTINYSKEITGISELYAVIGGFHLPANNEIYENALYPTLNEIQKSDPKFIIPCHCTGWKATNKIIDLMPDKFIQPSIGTVFTF